MMLDLLDIFSDQASIVLPTFKSDIWVLLKIAAECLQNVHNDIDLVFSDYEYLLKGSINGMSLNALTDTNHNEHKNDQC